MPRDTLVPPLHLSILNAVCEIRRIKQKKIQNCMQIKHISLVISLPNLKENKNAFLVLCFNNKKPLLLQQI